MKKLATVILFLSVSSVLSGQGKPAWVDEIFRKRNFPENEYITGFAYGKLSGDRTVQEATGQMKTEAEADLSKKILAKISSRAISDVSATSANGQYLENEVFASRSVTESATELAGIKTESYYDTPTRTVYAFAFVKRDDLLAFCKRKIHQDLLRVEIAVGLAEELAAAGKRMSARNKLEETMPIFGDVRFYRNQLVAVDAASDESALQNEREKTLLHTVERLLSDLQQIAAVYVDCRHENRGGKNDAFNSDPRIFCGIIAQALSENDCNITDKREEADYELTLVTSTTQRSDGTGEFAVLSYYANVKGSLYNRKTGKKTVDFDIFNDPAVYATGKTPEEAATKAFKLTELKDMTMEKIKRMIQ